MIDWRIYYDDGTVFDSGDGPWSQAPNQGVVAVVVRDRTEVYGRFVYSGYAPVKGDCPTCGRGQYNDVFVCRPETDEPYATHNSGPFEDYMRANHPHFDPNDWIKFGRQVPQLEWQNIMKRASRDKDFDKKSPRRRSKDFGSGDHPDNN